MKNAGYKLGTWEIIFKWNQSKVIFSVNFELVCCLSFTKILIDVISFHPQAEKTNTTSTLKVNKAYLVWNMEHVRFIICYKYDLIIIMITFRFYIVPNTSIQRCA